MSSLLVNFIDPNSALIGSRLILTREEYLREGELVCSIHLTYRGDSTRGSGVGSILLEMDHSPLSEDQFQEYARQLITDKRVQIEAFLGRFEAPQL